MQFLGLFTSKLLLWAMVVREWEGEVVSLYEQCVTLFRGIFDYAPEGKEVTTHLPAIKQGNSRVVEYALEFLMLAAKRGWNESALKAVSGEGLDINVVTELPCWDEEDNLSSLTDLAIQLDNLLKDWRSCLLPSSQTSQRTPPAPLQPAHTNLSTSECDHHQREHLCIYCGQADHVIGQCPEC